MDNCEICREHANGGTYYDDADCYICNLQAENAKLRKAVEAAPDLQRVKRAWAIYLGSGGMKWIDAWHNAEEAV